MNISTHETWSTLTEVSIAIFLIVLCLLVFRIYFISVKEKFSRMKQVRYIISFFDKDGEHQNNLLLMEFFSSICILKGLFTIVVFFYVSWSWGLFVYFGGLVSSVLARITWEQLVVGSLDHEKIKSWVSSNGSCTLKMPYGDYYHFYTDEDAPVEKERMEKINRLEKLKVHNPDTYAEVEAELREEKRKKEKESIRKEIRDLLNEDKS